MVKKFEFKQENRAVLDICGSEYIVEMTAENIALADKIKVQIGEVAKEARNKEGAESITYMCEFCAGSIDKLLGDGSIEKMFTDRTATLPDLIDLLVFIIDEMYAVFENVKSRYLNASYGVNK